VPESVAVRFHIMPIRVLGPELVVAADEAAYPLVRDELTKSLKDPVIFVLCSHQQISRALRHYYQRCSAA
jgi:type II secretion system (T2SS) protein E